MWPLVRATGLALALQLGGPARGQTTPAPAAPPEAPKATAAPTAPPATPKDVPKAPALPLEQRPYVIRAQIKAAPSARLDARGLDLLIAGWEGLVHRFVGAPWRVEVRNEADGPLATSDPATFDVATGLSAASGADKVWVITVEGSGAGYAFLGREYDAATRRVGPLLRQVAPVARDAPRVLLRFTLDLFSPYGLIADHFAKGATLTVQGAAIEPASESGRVVAKGQVYLPLRVAARKDGTPVVTEIPFSFLRVEAAAERGATCSVVSALSDPFTKRVVQKTYLAALRVKPGEAPTRLKFTTLPDRAPAAGYVLTARTLDDALPRDAGTTDREGRLTLKPGFTDGLTIFRLLAGGSEPMREFPLMPGLDDREILVPAFDPLPATVALEARIDSLRDAVVDNVALRARLQSRLKARFDGEDWAGAEEALREFAALPAKAAFADQLKALRDAAALEQAQTKKAVLTRNAQAQITDLEALIDRYLDEELFQGYAEALAKLKTGPQPKAKARGQSKAAAG